MIRTIEIEYLFDSQKRLSNELRMQLAWLLHGACVAVCDCRSIRITECEERLPPLMYRSSPCACHVGIVGVESGVWR